MHTSICACITDCLQHVAINDRIYVLRSQVVRMQRVGQCHVHNVMVVHVDRHLSPPLQRLLSRTTFQDKTTPPPVFRHQSQRVNSNCHTTSVRITMSFENLAIILTLLQLYKELDLSPPYDGLTSYIGIRGTDCSLS